MSGFIKGANRQQATLFPERLDDFIHEDSSVRVIDAFIDSLKLGRLGFCTRPSNKGRPGYHPSLMLKLYVYGYLNRVQSSRRLEREAQRNVELMWLLGRLAPDFKTIADFRRDNGKAIHCVCREFVMLCKRLALLSGDTVAVDGSKFKAVNNADRAFSKGKMKRRREKINESIEKYLEEIARADRQATKESRKTKATLQGRLEKVKAEAQRLKLLEEEMLKQPDQQISQTDPDARIMATRGRSSVMVGYNVQSIVEAKNHLIISHEVTNVGNDRTQLANMGKKAKKVLGTKKLKVVADKGYFNGSELLACEKAKILAYVPKTKTSNSKAAGLYDRADFVYDSKTDSYRCPANQVLPHRGRSLERGRNIDTYFASNPVCAACSKKPLCTTGVHRRVRRWEHEYVIDNLDKRMANEPEQMRIRRQTVEHPFGTIKSWMGHTHFLTRTMERVSTEITLHVLSYNLRRVINLLGPERLIKAITA